MVKSKTFYYIVYSHIKEGKSPIQISQTLNISKQRVNYYISFLKNKGIIRKNKSGIFEILKDIDEKTLLKQVKGRSKKISSLGTGLSKPIINLHAFQINFPILEGEIKDEDWKIKEKLKNWIPKYTTLTNLGGLTLKNNNNKSLTIFAHARNLKNLSEVHNLAFKIRAFISEYFKKKYNVILDVFNCETKNLNLATQDKEAEEMISKGERFELDLDKISEKIFKNDKLKAKAWIDGSPFQFSAETNDLEWKRAYLQMPFNMRNTLQAVNYIAQNYASHAGIVEKLNHLLEEQKVKKHIRKKVLEQTKLGDFI